MASFMLCLFRTKLSYFFSYVMPAQCITQKMPHAMVIIPRQPWSPWRTMVSRTIFNLGDKFQNCIPNHDASHGVDGVSKETVFHFASAMATMVVTPLLWAGLRGGACEVQSWVTFCCASLGIRSLSQKYMLASLLILRRPLLPWQPCCFKNSDFSEML